jgi:hypothetical protein
MMYSTKSLFKKQNFLGRGPFNQLTHPSEKPVIFINVIYAICLLSLSNYKKNILNKCVHLNLE